MNYLQLVPPRLDLSSFPGWCLKFVQDSFGAPVMHSTATEAANATEHRDHSRDMPDVAVPVWFWHYGTYNDRPGEYGHVVIWVPRRGFLSSPVSGFGSLWLSSIEAVERTFQATYRFWSLDINTLQVAQKAVTPPTRKKPMYHSHWIKDGLRQDIPGTNKFRYLHLNKKKDVTSVFGPALVSGETSIRVTGQPGTNVWHSAVRDKTDKSGKTVQDHVFIEEVTGVIPSTGSLTLTLPVTNKVDAGYRLRGMVRVDKPVKIERYAQKFMVWR